jgi:hypothetical protein
MPVSHAIRRLVKRRRALVETNPPRNSQLQLIETDERRESVRKPALGVLLCTPLADGRQRGIVLRPIRHRIERLPMPQKTYRESCRAAASTLCAASLASNSAGGKYPSAECRRLRL